MMIQSIPLPNFGVMQSKLPKPLWDRIKEVCVDNRCDDTEDYHHKLAGVIRDEYAIHDKEIKLGLQRQASLMIKEYYVTCGYGNPDMGFYTTQNDIWRRTKKPLPSFDTYMNPDRNGKVGYFQDIGCWVNYQKKYEFNPIHNHTGDFSIVVFCKIPYDVEEEKNFMPTSSKAHMQLLDIVKTSDLEVMRTPNQNGNFGFVYSDLLGRAQQSSLILDKTWEGVMLLFPSDLLHYVYPFYTSDEERITISANYLFQREKLSSIEKYEDL